MLYIVKWIYLWILPLGGILAALIAVLIYMFRHHSPGRKGLLGVTIILYALSIEPVGDALLWPLERQCSQPTAQEVQGDVIVLLGGGARAGVIYIDDKSRNTAENAAFTKKICRKNNWNHPIVVTSAFHMPRAIRFFAREAMDLTPYPCDYRASDSFRMSAYSIVPQAYILYHSCLAIKEYVGLIAAACRLQ